MKCGNCGKYPFCTKTNGAKEVQCNDFIKKEFNASTDNVSNNKRGETAMNKIIGVDFDGTLATTTSHFPDIGEPIPEIINYILEEQHKRCVFSFSYYA